MCLYFLCSKYGLRCIKETELAFSLGGDIQVFSLINAFFLNNVRQKNYKNL